MILARSQTMNHPLGAKIQTPLLIPSFSSKGFRMKKVNSKRFKSEISDVFRLCYYFLNDSLLVSAYDIYYKAIPSSTNFFAKPEITFIDSGGYETSEDYDASEIYKYNAEVFPWDFNKLSEIHSSWKNDILPAVFVSYDSKKERMPIEGQVELARKNLVKYPFVLHDFLIKPEKSGQEDIKSALKKIKGDPELLNGFHIIGVTEKEIGNSMQERMLNIARLRMTLDEAKNNAPIHVFGSLDPICTPLYFISGAEIFDGLSWIRYGYHNGVASYIFNYSNTNLKIHERQDIILAKTLMSNLSYLKDLELQMKNYVSSENLNKFKYHKQIMMDYLDIVMTELGVK